MAASPQQLQTVIDGLIVSIAAAQRELGAAQRRLAVAQQTNNQTLIDTEQQRVERLSVTLDNLETQLDTAERALAQTNEPGLIPPPARSAGQIVDDDNVNNPLRRPPLETDPETGRLFPIRTTTAPTNADITPTVLNGDFDFGTNQAVRTLNQTQAVLQAIPRGFATLQSLPQQGQNGGLIPVFGDPRLGTSGRLPAQVSGVVAPTAPGVGQIDDNIAPTRQSNETNLNEVYNSDLPVQPEPNYLDNFASYTYGISVYLMTPQQYKTFITSKQRNVSGYNLLFQSGGAPGSGTGSQTGVSTSTFDEATQTFETIGTLKSNPGRNPFFDVDFYIDQVTIENLLPGKQTRAAHMASTIKFTVVEPNGITLIDRLYKAVQDHVPKDGAGNINYTAVQYLMAIRWYGYDNNGNLITNLAGDPGGLSDPNAAIEKFIPFLIKGIKWSVSNKLVTYEFEAAPVGQIIASSTARGTIYYDIELTNGTVGKLLAGDADFNQTQTDPGDAQLPPEKANAAPTNKVTVKQGLMAALNEIQQRLVRSGYYEKADIYEIEFAAGAEAIRDAVLAKPGEKKNIKASPVAPPPTVDPKGLDPARTSVDNTIRNVPITAGQQVIQIIDQVIRNSSFVYDQARIETTEDSDQYYDISDNPEVITRVFWYQISMESTPLEYDFKRNDYAYRVKYIISPYLLQNFDSKYFPLPKFAGIHKRYNYWFTGENVSVLDYEAKFNHFYNLTVSGSVPGDSATERVRRKYTSSMREIPKYVYQSRSSESLSGANFKGNEVNANAAEYLYNPSDLGSLKLRIVGDPAWIQQGSAAEGVDPAAPDYNAFLPDGTINFDSQQILFEIAWQRPSDYDLNTGLADPYATRGGQREPQQSYIYQATKVLSEFRQGRFEQVIDGTLYLFPVPNPRNSVTDKSAAVAVNNNGADPRDQGVATVVADLGTLSGAQRAAPPVIDIVNTQPGINSSIPGESTVLSNQTINPVTSNGITVTTAIPAPRKLGAVDQAQVLDTQKIATSN
jgi:hypothetical protein